MNPWHNPILPGVTGDLLSSHFFPFIWVIYHLSFGFGHDGLRAVNLVTTESWTRAKVFTVNE